MTQPNPAQPNSGDEHPQPAPPAEENDLHFRLDPERMPQRLDLMLRPEQLDGLERLAARSGRSLDEIVVELIARQVHHQST